MSPTDKSSTPESSMPDVASTGAQQIRSKLDWVGMSEVHLPARVLDTVHGERPISASIQSYVNLVNEEAKGIHMSRLYLLLEEMFADAAVSTQSIAKLLEEFLASHEGLSTRAFVQLDFEFSVKRKSLKSEYAGWKSYPVSIVGTLDEGGITVELVCEILYSSTCPCSAALARQLIQQQFEQDFASKENVDKETILNWLGSEEGIMATPHSQRSHAQVKVLLDHATGDGLPITALIDLVENSLKTPVQTAVKREDEQEFARLNGQNLMFCEDAARRLKDSLNGEALYKDFWLRVNHLESLHAHNAVSVVTKDIIGGYLPIP